MPDGKAGIKPGAHDVTESDDDDDDDDPLESIIKSDRTRMTSPTTHNPTPMK